MIVWRSSRALDAPRSPGPSLVASTRVEGAFLLFSANHHDLILIRDRIPSSAAFASQTILAPIPRAMQNPHQEHQSMLLARIIKNVRNRLFAPSMAGHLGLGTI